MQSSVVSEMGTGKRVVRGGWMGKGRKGGDGTGKRLECVSLC